MHTASLLIAVIFNIYCYFSDHASHFISVLTSITSVSPSNSIMFAFRYSQYTNRLKSKMFNDYQEGNLHTCDIIGTTFVLKVEISYSSQALSFFGGYSSSAYTILKAIYVRLHHTLVCQVLPRQSALTQKAFYRHKYLF